MRMILSEGLNSRAVRLSTRARERAKHAPNRAKPVMFRIRLRYMGRSLGYGFLNSGGQGRNSSIEIRASGLQKVGQDLISVACKAP